MPRGDKSKYTSKQKRKAQHIEEGYESRGVSEGEAERRAWATVNKLEGGGKRGGSGSRSSSNRSTSKSSSSRRTARTNPGSRRSSRTRSRSSKRR